jgi:hypothetical protein
MTIRLKDMVAAGLIGTACYLGTHLCPRATAELASACLTSASGFIWAISTLLSKHRERLANRLSFAAAISACLGGACLLP